MSKNTPSPAKAKADIDFEKELWDAANELRGTEAENQYKDYVLSLLFEKHLSIINDDFLATAKEKKSGNELKLELIRQIMNDEIKLRANKNLVKSRRLKEEVEKVIADYHNHFFDSLVALEKLRDIAGRCRKKMYADSSSA